MDNLVAQKVIDQNIFSVQFKPIKEPEDIGTVGGKLTLGGLPPKDSYKGDIQWLPHIQDDGYEVCRYTISNLIYNMVFIIIFLIGLLVHSNEPHDSGRRQ